MFARTALQSPPATADAPTTELDGRRCDSCGRSSALALVRCSRCGGPMREARFGPEGTVWSSTVVHLDGIGPAAPYQLAYLDLDRGPRALVLVQGEAPADVGSRLRVRGRDASGNPIAVPA